MPSEQATISPSEAMAAELAAQVRQIELRESERRAKRDRRYPFGPGIYIVAAVTLVALVFLTSFPAAVDVGIGLAVVFMLVSFYRAGERMMEQVAAKNNAPKSDYWKG